MSGSYLSTGSGYLSYRPGANFHLVTVLRGTLPFVGNRGNRGNREGTRRRLKRADPGRSVGEALKGRVYFSCTHAYAQARPSVYETDASGAD